MLRSATRFGASGGNDVGAGAGSTCYATDVDSREKAAWEILDAARKQRYRWPRWLWTWSILISAICLGALAIRWLNSE
jgi:hypothetical protein